MKLEILTPEKKLFTGEVYSVQVPGSSGRFQMLSKHAPIVSSIKKGVEYFDKNLVKPRYFIWSNNFTGIEDFFPSTKFTLVKDNIKRDPAYDLYLMSLCKNFILSPSTMHYCGAFLSKHNNKICLSPANITNKSGYYGFSNNKDIKADWWKEIY